MLVTPVTDAVTVGDVLGGLALIVVVAMVAILIAKEISSSLPGERARRLSSGLNVLIIPVLTLFLATVALRLLGPPH